MCQLSNKQPPSIIFFILNSKNLVVILISSNKLFFGCYYEELGNALHHFVWTIVLMRIYMLKSGSYLPKMIVLFGSMNALYKLRKILFITS